ncbi:MAG TPA: SoxR reducing system RseC family protein [Bacteroidales bacterium]|nr:SoxR reducing system RseC family protein [Bacteroidales bacterium]
MLVAKAGSIEHSGVVHEISEGTIKVKILVSSACSSCRANTMCGSSSGEKIIEINQFDEPYSIGEEVMLRMHESLGFKAIVWGYLLPFVLVMICLIGLLLITGNEALSGIISLIVLVPYYLVIFLLRDRFKRVFRFEISKIIN